LVELNKNGNMGCGQDYWPVIEEDTVEIENLGHNTSFGSYSFSLIGDSNTVVNETLISDTACWCPGIPEIDLDYTFCADSIYFEVDVTPDGTLSDLDWNFGDGNTSLDINPVHLYDSTGSYVSIFNFVDTTSCAGMASIVVDFVPYPSDFSFSYDDSLLKFDFYDTTNFFTDWLWDFGDGIFDSIQSPTHFYDSAGTYIVCLIGSNECFSDTICQSIEVFSDVSLPSFERKLDVFVYPNPLRHNSIVTYSNVHASGVRIKILNVSGQEVFSDYQLGEPYYSLSHLRLLSGVYFLELTFDDGLRGYAKLVVE